MAAKLGTAYGRRLVPQVVDELADKIRMHWEVINIGEKDHDHNRFIWDGLAVFKRAIAAILLSSD